MHTVTLKLGSYIERHLNISADEGWLVIDEITSSLRDERSHWRTTRNGVFWTNKGGERCSATIHKQYEIPRGCLD